MPPIFHLLAIVQSPEGALRVMASARALGDVPIGVMLRDPEHRPERVRALADAIAISPLPPSVTLIANGIVLPGIDAVHIPSAGLYGSLDALGMLPRLVGFSTHDLAEIGRAEELGADYVTFGPIFPTASKRGHAGHGLAALAQACAATRLPLFALGGITVGNHRSCLDAGAYGIASISLFGETIPHDLLTNRQTP